MTAREALNGKGRPFPFSVTHAELPAILPMIADNIVEYIDANDTVRSKEGLAALLDMIGVVYGNR
jgi:hypothetical protein